MTKYTMKYGKEKAVDKDEKTSHTTKGSRKKYSDEDKYTKKDKPRKTYEKGSDRKHSNKKEAKGVAFSFEDDVRLNKFISHSGYCSRREADRLIELGLVKVNGDLVTELGVKVKNSDIVIVDGDRLTPEAKYYVLLNKPKGFISTTDDPHERKTVMELIKNACNERIYPVGRLDRNTTGLLLFTNDGELAKTLTHPRYETKKIYRVGLDKKISKEELQQIAEGIELDDGHIKVDAIEYVGNSVSKMEVGVELHSGKNRIIRRLFEKMGFDVVKLDRTIFASLSKKDLPRGKWRHLSEKEVRLLKMNR